MHITRFIDLYAQRIWTAPQLPPPVSLEWSIGDTSNPNHCLWATFCEFIAEATTWQRHISLSRSVIVEGIESHDSRISYFNSFDNVDFISSVVSEEWEREEQFLMILSLEVDVCVVGVCLGIVTIQSLQTKLQSPHLSQRTVQIQQPLCVDWSIEYGRMRM